MTDADGERRDRQMLERLETLRARIGDACARSGRAPEEVTLVGVSKRQSTSQVAAAIRAGVTQIGENYVAELRDRRADVRALLADPSLESTIVWRFIGALQRNKAKVAVSLASVVDSVDRESLAIELDRRAGAAGLVLPICLQVNVSREPQKSGVEPGALPALLEVCVGLSNLEVTGLMTIPARADDPEESRRPFARLRALRDTLSADSGQSLHELSMGMSGDFEVAIEEGATLVRVGTALFGPRPD